MCTANVRVGGGVFWSDPPASPSRRAISTTASGNSRLTEPCSGASRGLLSQNRHDTIDAPVERGNYAEARALRVCRKVGISEIEAMYLVQLDGALEECTIDEVVARLGLEFGLLDIS